MAHGLCSFEGLSVLARNHGTTTEQDFFADESIQKHQHRCEKEMEFFKLAMDDLHKLSAMEERPPGSKDFIMYGRHLVRVMCEDWDSNAFSECLQKDEAQVIMRGAEIVHESDIDFIVRHKSAKLTVTEMPWVASVALQDDEVVLGYILQLEDTF